MISLEYMAGFFDGEGCIKISREKNHSRFTYRLRIGIGQKDRSILIRIKQAYGGIVVACYDKRYNKTYYEWDTSAQRAFQILKQIYPYLQLKKLQAKLAIEFQEIVHNYRKNSRPTEIERIEKFSYYETAKEEMHFLKK